jgi:ribosomal-protein-serine acetyltransferase
MEASVLGAGIVRLRIDDETELRQTAIGDAAAILAMVEPCREHLAQHIPLYDAWHTPEDVEGMLGAWDAQHEAVGSLYAGIWQGDECLGLVSLEIFDKNDGLAAIGFTVAHKCEGRSLAFRASDRLLKYAFEEAGARRIFARTTTGNARAQKLLARLGFMKEGVLREALKLRGEYVDLDTYALLKHEWAAAHRPA